MSNKAKCAGATLLVLMLGIAGTACAEFESGDDGGTWTTRRVPDASATIQLLGASLLALEFIRRKLKSE